MENSAIREIGIPVRSVNRALLYPSVGADGRPRIIGTMSQQADGFFILIIDPDDGSFRQIPAPDSESNYTTAVHTARDGRVYIGAAHTGQLYCYDPIQEDLLDLGTINPEKAIFPCLMDEEPGTDGAAGRIWISSYGTADLTSYDPETGTFTRYGRLDEIDMYSYCYVNTDGTIASLITQTKPHVVVLDPKSGEKRTVGPVVTKGEGTLTFHRGTDGLLYIVSSEGNFRVDGMEAIPVEKAAPPAERPAVLSDGRAFRYSDAHGFINRNLEITDPDGTVHSYRLDYDAAGTNIFCLHGGPNKHVYGSSVLPEHFFGYDLASGNLTDYGACSESGGEAYSMATFDDKVYISSYPGARISIYDPAKPYDFNDKADSNPKDIGRLDDISYRPRSTLAGPAGKVWFASIPDYGMWGGPLAWYDPSKDEKHTYYRICGDASCYTLAWVEDVELIAVGTTVAGGSGTQPKVDAAQVFFFDYKADAKVCETTPVDSDDTIASRYGDPKAVSSLVAIPRSRILGVVRYESGSRFFSLDAATFEYQRFADVSIGRVVDNGLVYDTDGRLYGLSHSCIFSLDPDTLETEVVVELGEMVADEMSAGPIIDGEFYYSAGHRVMAARIE